MTRPIRDTPEHAAPDRAESDCAELTGIKPRESLSFIVPAFNARATIDATLRAVLSQTVPCPVIVVDDGSTDDTSRLVRAFGDARITLVRQRNAGLAAARNAGWREARTPVIAFLDSDDLVAPEFAERMLQGLDVAGPGADAIACGWRMLSESGGDLGWETILPSAALSPESVRTWNPVPVGAVALRRAGVRARLEPDRRDRPFDESLPVLEDWDLWRRLARAGVRFADPVHEPLFGYRLRAGSMSRSLDAMHQTGLTILERAGEDLATTRQWHTRWLARAAACEDAPLVRTLLGSLGTLAPAERELLQAELFPALCWADAVPPHRAAPRRDDWTRRIERWLGSIGGLDLPAVGVSLPSDDRSWRTLASLINERAGERVVVLYGMGRHGLALAAQLDRLLPRTRLAWCDDDERSRGPRGWARLRPDLLTPRHAIVVTPTASAGIERRLRSLGLERYDTLRSLGGALAVDR